MPQMEGGGPSEALLSPLSAEHWAFSISARPAASVTFFFTRLTHWKENSMNPPHTNYSNYGA